MSVAHRFNIGSIGKEFSGAAVAILARSGRLKYDDKVGQHISGLPQWANDISIEHLLTYSTGLPQAPAGATWDAALTDKTIRGWLTSVQTLPAKPGTTYLYNIYSPFLLALVIERASGSTLPAFLRETLFRPAGMRRTELEQEMPVDAPLRSKASDANGVHDYFPLRLTLPLVYTNAPDLFSWAQALGTGRVLKQRELDHLATPLTPHFDMHGYTAQQTIFGNVRRERGKLVAIRHQGGHLHFNSMLFIDLKANVTVIVLSNHTADGELYRVTDGVYEIAMKSP